MADHMIKMSEVPKGQRYQQFKDYYRIPLLCLIIGIVMLVSILKTTVFSPKPDAFLVITTSYDIASDFQTLTESLYSEKGQDFNGDEKALISVTPITYNELTMKTDPEVGMAMQTKLMGVLSSAENIMQIVDEDMFKLFEGEGLIGTYADLEDKENTFNKPLDEKIKIPLSEIPFFASEEYNGKTDGLYMTIRPRDGSQLGNKEKKIKAYNNQITAFMNLFK